MSDVHPFEVDARNLSAGASTEDPAMTVHSAESLLSRDTPWVRLPADLGGTQVAIARVIESHECPRCDGAHDAFVTTADLPFGGQIAVMQCADQFAWVRVS